MAALGEENKNVVISAVADAVSALEGVELVEMKFYSEYGSFVVEALIWRKGGVDLELCEVAHGVISDALDRLDDLFESAYILKVSSQGLDRKIVTDDDMRRALDTEIEFKAADGKKHHGILKSFDADTATVAAAKGEKVFERKYMTGVQPYIRF